MTIEIFISALASSVAMASAAVCINILKTILSIKKDHAFLLNQVQEVKSKHLLRGFSECEHCHSVVTQFFIDGCGRVTCKTCKPIGFKNAIDANSAKL